MNSFRRPEMFLFLMAAAMPIAFGVWQALLNNFVIERAGFTGLEIGILQSLREIPGFLAFGAVLLLAVMREQTLALVSMLLLGVGTAITGFFPSEIGLYCTTVLMSLGYHYYETINQSLSLQLFPKKDAPYRLGQMVAVGSFASLVAYALIWLALDVLGLQMETVYLLGGSVAIIIALYCWVTFPRFPQTVEQHKHLVLRKRYWLYYALTFMGGARRQIFVVFAGFLMVEKFHYSVSDIALLYLVNQVLNILFARKIGRLIGRIGERKTLIIEYCGLILVFSGYAVVNQAEWAAALYIVDHLFFAMAIAVKSYSQKIADPADIASSAGVSRKLPCGVLITCAWETPPLRA